MTRIQLDNGFIELRKDINFPITLAFADIKDNGARSGGFSKVLDIEGSNNNENIIGKYFDVDLSNDNFDRNKKTPCSVIQNGTEVFTGFVQLVEVVRVNAVRGTNQKSVNYKIAVFDEVANFFLAMGDKELTELDFSDLGHVFNRANIIASWSNTEGYIYPQFAKDDNIYTLRDFKPAIFELDYIKRIFASNGYTFTFDQATDNDIRLNKRFIPFNGKDKDETISEFLKEKFKVRGEDEALSFIIDEATTPTFPIGWLPIYDYLTGFGLRNYTNEVGSKVVLDSVFEDASDQYDAINHKIINKAGGSRTLTFLTEYDYTVNVRAVNSVSAVVAWDVNFTSFGVSRCEVCLTLVAQSLTDNNKRVIIDAGTQVIEFNNGGTYSYGAAYELLGSGTNASLADLGLFDDLEELDVHAVITARYFDAFGNIIPNLPPYGNISVLSSDSPFVNVPCEFIDAGGEPVRLEFDIDITNIQFTSVPDIQDLVKGADVDPTIFIPKKVKQRDLISSVFKSYNIIASPDPNDETNIILKTRDKYYDDGEEWDWTTKLDEQQENSITFLSNEVNREQRYRYKSDKDIINQAYQDEFNQTYGETQIRLDNEYTSSEDVRELIYSPTPSIKSGIGVPLPSINGAIPDNNVRVLLSNGKKNVYAYPFYDDIIPNASELAYIDEYLNNSMFNDDFIPNFSILFDSPKALFHGFQQGQTSNYLYNLHHKRELTTINSGKMLTGYFDLTERDFQKLSKRLDYKIFIKDNGWFYISKVHNYNGVVRTLTKVDLVTADDNTKLKFRTPIKPVAPVKPSLPVREWYKQVSRDTNVVIGNFANYIDGKYNLVVGSNVRISGDGNKVLSDDVIILGSYNDVPTGMNNTKVIGDNESPKVVGTYIEGLYNNLVFVARREDFPAAVAGVITLEAEVTYFITDHIDLLGDRLVGAENTTIIGGSSENCTITSTGLGVKTPLFTTEWTTPIRHISFKDVGVALSIDGTSRVVALDWTGVNFVNVGDIGIIDSVDNFIFTKGAFLNSGKMGFDGTIGTVAFTQSLFDAFTGVTLFDLKNTLTITRRFRIDYSSLIVLSGETGISLDGAATIPDSGIILDTCNFAGGGTYLSGIDYQSNKALFVNNVGIINSRENSLYYMNGNATATVIAATGVAVKVAGTTTSGSVTSKFTNTDNRATYTGAIDRLFKLTATMSIESGNNNIIGIYVAKNGTLITDSEVYITTNAGGRAEGAAVQASVQLSDTDYLEIWVENDTSTTNITVTNMNVIIE